MTTTESSAKQWWDPAGEEWPLLFSATSLIQSDRFTARVEIQGAFVATIADDRSCWLDGVFPAAIAAGGATLDDAYRNFCNYMFDVLRDNAAESISVDAFRDQVTWFVTEDLDEKTKRCWEAGIERVRAGKTENAPPIQRKDATHWKPKAVVADIAVLEDSHGRLPDQHSIPKLPDEVPQPWQLAA